MNEFEVKVLERWNVIAAYCQRSGGSKCGGYSHVKLEYIVSRPIACQNVSSYSVCKVLLLTHPIDDTLSHLTVHRSHQAITSRTAQHITTTTTHQRCRSSSPASVVATPSTSRMAGSTPSVVPLSIDAELEPRSNVRLATVGDAVVKARMASHWYRADADHGKSSLTRLLATKLPELQMCQRHFH